MVLLFDLDFAFAGYVGSPSSITVNANERQYNRETDCKTGILCSQVGLHLFFDSQPRNIYTPVEHARARSCGRAVCKWHVRRPASKQQI